MIGITGNTWAVLFSQLSSTLLLEICHGNPSEFTMANFKRFGPQLSPGFKCSQLLTRLMVDHAFLGVDEDSGDPRVWMKPVPFPYGNQWYCRISKIDNIYVCINIYMMVSVPSGAYFLVCQWNYLTYWVLIYIYVYIYTIIYILILLLYLHTVWCPSSHRVVVARNCISWTRCLVDE